MLRIIKFIRPFAKYLVAVWLVTILIVSSIPNIPTLRIHTSKSEFRLDYIMHFCEYGLLAFLTLLSFAGDEFRTGFRKAIIIIISLILLAFLDELHQKLIPGRTYSINDILSDITGILSGMIFCLTIFRFIRNGLNRTR